MKSKLSDRKRIPIQDTPPHLIENPAEKPVMAPSMKSLDSNFEGMLRAALTQPVSDAGKRPPIVKRADQDSVQVLP